MKIESGPKYLWPEHLPKLILVINALSADTLACIAGVSKPLILPTYRKIYDSLESSDVSGLREWRRKLRTRNRLRAVLQLCP